MKVKHMIEFLKEFNGELNVELHRVIAIKLGNDPVKDEAMPYIIGLDAPIFGAAEKDGDLLLCIEAAPEMTAFGKDIKRLDGKPMTQEDIDSVKAKN